MTLQGRVERVEGILCTVCLIDESCGHDCSACAGCSKKAQGRKLLATNSANAMVGDRVLLSAPTQKVAIASFLVFLLPVLLTVGGYGLGRYLLWNRPAALLMAAPGLMIGILACKLYSVHLRKQSQTVYSTVMIIQETEV